MPPDDEKADDSNLPSSSSSSFTRQANKVKDLFSIPAPVKRLFDKFPVLTYAPNELPQRTPPLTKLPTLYVFIKEEDAAAGRPSFNPGCLKWQVRYAKAFDNRLLIGNRPSSRLLKFNTDSFPRIIMLHLLEFCLSSYLRCMPRKAPKSYPSLYLPTSLSSSH